MKTLYSEEEFNNSKGIDKLPCECYKCCKIFYKLKKEIVYELKN